MIISYERSAKTCQGEPMNRFRLLLPLKRKNQLLLGVLLPVLYLFSCTTPSKTEDKGWVEATGVAAIIDNEVGKASDDALNDAKLQAVKKVLGTVIRGRVDVADGEFLRSELSAKTEGFIETYEVLSRRAVSSIEYQVKIRAKVSATKIDEAIDEIILRQGRPVMMVILNENFLGEISQGTGPGATAIESIFTQKGFPLSDPLRRKRAIMRQRQRLGLALGGDNNAAGDIGEEAGAEIVLVGSAIVIDAGPIRESNLHSIQADITIRVIEVDTGNILATAQAHGAYPHINPRSGAIEALKKAALKASIPLISQITRTWMLGRYNTIDLLISGLDYKQIKKLRSELLEKIRGVRAVHRKSGEGQSARLQVEFMGTAFTLLDRITDAKLSYTFTPGRVTRGAVELKANPE